MPILKLTSFWIVMNRILIFTVTLAIRSTSPPVLERASTSAAKPTPANVMPNSRASTSALNLTRKTNSDRPVLGSVSSLSTTEKLNSPTRPNEREPSTSSPCNRRPKWPLESIQPSADSCARPKKSIDAATRMNQSPGPNVSVCAMSGSVLITTGVTPSPPTWIVNEAFILSTSRMFSVPSRSSRKPGWIVTLLGSVLFAPVLLRRSLPAAWILMMSITLTSSATSRYSTIPFGKTPAKPVASTETGPSSIETSKNSSNLVSLTAISITPFARARPRNST